MGNGCNFFPDKIFSYVLKPACDTHDFHYWYQDITRKESDKSLRIDANKILPFWLRFVGWIMYFGIRIGGWYKWNKYKGGNK